jgi:spore coat polysaccharide biosynthesis predicted glycosyltransferase SpsG
MTDILIAVDSRSSIGAGHVSRSIAVAEELRKREYSILWHVSDLSNFLNLLTFFRVGSEILNEININHIQYSSVDTLVLDTYDVLFAEEVTQLCNPNSIIQIVDEFSPDSILASVRWSGSILSEKARMRLEKNCELYSGLQFVPLRNEVKELREASLNSRHKRDSIIISLGTSDLALQMIDKVVDVIESSSRIKDVFISHPNFQENSQSGTLKKIDPSLMLTTAVKYNSLVISGGGLTALELLYLRLNFLVLEVSANQAVQIEYLCNNDYTDKLQLIDFQRDKDILMRGLSRLRTADFHNLDSLGQGSSLLVDWIDRNQGSGK